LPAPSPKRCRPSKRTPDEQAALHAIERDAEVKSTSPFLRGPEGDDHHSQWLDTAMKAMTGDGPGTRGPVKPIAREAIAGGADDVGDAHAGARAAQGENPQRRGAARRPQPARLECAGPYQFEPRTWVSLFKRRYPGDTRSFDQIAALREDPHLNDVLINDLIAENSAALRTPASRKARRTSTSRTCSDRTRRSRCSAPTRMPGSPTCCPTAISTRTRSSPTGRRRNARLGRQAHGRQWRGPGSMRSLAYRGGRGSARGSARRRANPDGRFDVDAMFYFGGIENDRPVLDPAHFGSPEEHAGAQVRFERERDAMEGYAPVATADELFSPHEHFGALKALSRGRSPPTRSARRLASAPTRPGARSSRCNRSTAPRRSSLPAPAVPSRARRRAG
jgi:hypothetical protein